jgi:MoxR-like ATPase
MTNSTLTTMATRSDCIRGNCSDVLKVLKFSSETRNPIVLWGVKAVGKTTMVKTFCEENGYRCVILHLASQGVEDLVGLMTRSLDTDDKKYFDKLLKNINAGKDLSPSENEWIKNAATSSKQKTIWTRPNWLTNDANNPTCYFLDEMNRANKFVMACMLPFLNEGRIHEHEIGPKDFIVAACNPSTGKYQVNDVFGMDEALKDRCGHMIVEPTKEEYFTYASDYIDDTTMKVIQKHSNIVSLTEFDLNFRIEPSRRSLVNIMQHFKVKDRNWIKENGRTILGAYLGSSFLNAWWNERFKSDEYLTIEQIKDCQDSEQAINEKMLTYIDGNESIKMDVLDSAIDTMTDWIREEYKDGITNLDWLLHFFNMKFIPKDSFVAFITRINLWDYPSLCELVFDSKILAQDERFIIQHEMSK